MTSAPLDMLFEALALPAAARAEQRIAKSMLIERGDLTAVDRKLVETGLERLAWRATLKPASTGLTAYADAVRDYSQLVVITAAFRPNAKVARLTEIIHRALPHPVVLLAGDPDGAVLSVGFKRRHEREADRTVLESLVDSPPVRGQGAAVERAFLESLALAAAPAHDLWGLYQAWAERAEAASAAEISGRFRLAADGPQAAARRETLATHAIQTQEVARLRRAASAEKRLARRLELAREAADAEARLARLTQDLT